MDFRQNQPTHNRPAGPAAPTAVPVGTKAPASKSGDGSGKWMKVLNVVILFGIAVLLAALAFGFTRSNDNEYKYVNTKQYQAVFLNNGQVYFGNIDSLNSKYVRLANIYYLTQTTTTNSSGQTVTDGNYSLVKLGCQQIHYPDDQMLINRDQVTFWENLNKDGKVVKSINDYIAQNKGKSQADICANVSTQTQASNNSGSGTQSTGTGSTSTGTGTTTTGTGTTTTGTGTTTKK